MSHDSQILELRDSPLANSRSACNSRSATGFARRTRSCRKSSTYCGESAILVASDSSAALAKPSKRAAS